MGDIAENRAPGLICAGAKRRDVKQPAKSLAAAKAIDITDLLKRDETLFVMVVVKDPHAVLVQAIGQRRTQIMPQRQQRTAE